MKLALIKYPVGGGGGSTVPGGNNTDVQFNNAGAFGGSDSFTWNNGTNVLTILGSVNPNEIKLPSTNSSGTTGLIYINGFPYINAFDTSNVVPGESTNVFIGTNAGNINLTNTGLGNNGIGFQSLMNISSGQNNAGFGIQTLLNLASGINNLAIGNYALSSATTAEKNVAIGTTTGQNLTIGIGNIFIGDNAGADTITGSTNIFIGPNMGNFAGDTSSQLYIGQDISGFGTLPIIYAQMANKTGRWNGKLGINFQTALSNLPTAQLHIAAGTAAAGTAPIKLTSGVVLTNTEDGTFEYDGTHLYFTIGVTRHTLI